MSCQENDRIMEAAQELAEQNGLLVNGDDLYFDLESAYEYLTTGELLCVKTGKGSR